MARGVQFPQVIYPRSHGKYSKLDMKPKSLIRRRKTYRDEEGVIVGYGAEEAYFVANPRDYIRILFVREKNEILLFFIVL